MTSTNNSWKAILGFFLLLGFVLFLSAMFIKSCKNDNKVKKEGVYVVAKVVSFEKRSNGRIFHFLYNFKQQQYSFSIKALGSEYSIGDLVFVRIAPSDPNAWLYDEEAPRPGICFNYESSPPEGWKEIPTCK
ncbi:MAG: hypothetical protein ACTHMC_11805 [Pseudobacter sp.]|uniref:hypothetical protein n=1 Tax=Pseudobacter sp. TaxID=2045420 RepID=UPI003F807153